jgi:hypothetical protein
MVICNFYVIIVKENENWLLVLKTVPGGVSWLFGLTGQISLAGGRNEGFSL